jgi:hypothetical protein
MLTRHRRRGRSPSSKALDGLPTTTEQKVTLAAWLEADPHAYSNAEHPDMREPCPDRHRDDIGTERRHCARSPEPFLSLKVIMLTSGCWGCPVRRTGGALASSLGGCRVGGLSSVRGCGLRSRPLSRRWLYGVAVTPRRSYAAMFSGLRVPGRSTGCRCWVSQFSRFLVSRSMICSGAGSPRSGLSTCRPLAAWLIADSSCCLPGSARTSLCGCAVPTIRSSGNCWRLSVLFSPIPRTLGESFSEGRTEDVPGGYHR